MRSDGFERFLRRLRAQGREKGDGFFPADVDGLSLPERDEARDLLVEAMRRGDTTAPGGLALLDGAGAVAPLTAALAELPFANDARLRAARELWQLTRGEGARQVIVEYLRHPSALTRLAALGYLAAMPPTPAVAPDLATLIEGEEDENNRAIAGELFLLNRGVVRDIRDAYRLHRPFMQAIESGDVEVRRAALARA